MQLQPTVRVLLAVRNHWVRNGLWSSLRLHSPLEIIGTPSTEAELEERLPHSQAHLVMLDEDLAGPGTPALCRRLKQEHDQVRLVFLYNKATPVLLQEAIAAGIHGAQPPSGAIGPAGQSRPAGARGHYRL